MTETDPRASFLARRAKLLRSINSGDSTASARLDALITEMEHVLGAADPDTLETLLEYVEMQELQGRAMNIWRTVDDDLAEFDSAFGVDSLPAARAQFVSVMQGLNSTTWPFTTRDATPGNELKEQRERVAREFGPAVVRLVRARGTVDDATERVTHATDCVSHLLKGQVDDAAHCLSQIQPRGSSGESWAWLIDSLSNSLSLLRKRQSPGQMLGAAGACEELMRFADSVIDDPTWTAFFDEHEVGLVLAQLVNGGLAVPTTDGTTLILEAWDVAAAKLQGRDGHQQSP